MEINKTMNVRFIMKIKIMSDENGVAIRNRGSVKSRASMLTAFSILWSFRILYLPSDVAARTARQTVREHMRLIMPASAEYVSRLFSELNAANAARTTAAAV